jgi:hypothetical protein
LLDEFGQGRREQRSVAIVDQVGAVCALADLVAA